MALYYREIVDLLNAWNRWLKSSVGRWNSMDPIGIIQGTERLYNYVDNEPIMQLDPSGLMVEPAPEYPEPEPIPDPNAKPWPEYPKVLPRYGPTIFDPIDIRNFFPPANRNQPEACALSEEDSLSIHNCRTWPLGPCDYGLRTEPRDPNMKGSVYCCQFERTPCNFMSPSERARPGGTFVKICPDIHEESHARDFTGMWCGPTGTGWLLYSQDSWKKKEKDQECYAYGAELSCLLTSFNLCHSSPGMGAWDRIRCRKNILEEIGTVCDNLKQQCGPGMYWIASGCYDTLKKLKRTWKS